jgi:hypothetical protein
MIMTQTVKVRCNTILIFSLFSIPFEGTVYFKTLKNANLFLQGEKCLTITKQKQGETKTGRKTRMGSNHQRKAYKKKENN